MNNWKTEIIMVAVFVLFFLFVYLPQKEQKEQNKLMQEQIQALLKAQNALAKPTNALPNIIIPAIGGVNPIPPMSNNPVIIETLPVNERVIAELVKKMNTGLTTSQIAAIVRGLTTKPDTVKVGVTDAKVEIRAPGDLDGRKLSEVSVKELRENLTIIVQPTVKILELEKPRSRIATCYTTAGNGLSYRFSETELFLLGKLALNGNLMLKEQDFKLGMSIGKDVRGTQLEIQAGGCYNFQQKQPEVFIGGAVHF